MKKIKRLLDLTLETLFDQTPIEFQSAYVYKKKGDQKNHECTARNRNFDSELPTH